MKQVKDVELRRVVKVKVVHELADVKVSLGRYLFEMFAKGTLLEIFVTL